MIWVSVFLFPPVKGLERECQRYFKHYFPFCSCLRVFYLLGIQPFEVLYPIRSLFHYNLGIDILSPSPITFISFKRTKDLKKSFPENNPKNQQKTKRLFIQVVLRRYCFLNG
jgi:hypothetical protein